MAGTSPLLRLIFAGLLAGLLCGCGPETDETDPTAGGAVDGGGNTNSPPVANAGPDRAANELTVVSLNGSGSDPNAGDALSFEWTQVAGEAVTIENATSAVAQFQSPDALPGTPTVLTFRLTVSDPQGLADSDDVTITVSEPRQLVSISGRLVFEAPVHNARCDGLNFNTLNVRPIRGATVQLMDDATQGVLQSTVSDEQGNYAFSNVDGAQVVFVRVRAELKKTGSPSWDVEVRNNTAQTHLPLTARPIYVLDGQPASPGGQDDIRDLRATTGWDSSTASFTGSRAAAPFSILDTVYAAMRLVVTADPLARFEPLDAYWSINNTSAGSGDVDSGSLGTSYYVNNGLYLLGKQGDDIEEFDRMVIAHEWGHYFEDTFSRSDSIGGRHGAFDRLDMRVAFGEGFATAIAGMALQDSLYCDALWFGSTLRGFDIRLEDENTDPSGSAPDTRGWYSEASVMKILYDLWDNDVDGADTGSIGFAPIYTVFVGPQASTQAFTSVFSFADALKSSVGSADAVLIDELLRAEDIEPFAIDEWGSTESNDAGSPITLPVYANVPPNGSIVNVCSSGEFDSIGPGATGNKLNTHRFLRVDIAAQQRYTFRIEADAETLAALPPDDPADDRDQSDPDMFYYRQGAVRNLCLNRQCSDVEGTSGAANQEVFTTQNPLSPGTYVVDFHDWRYDDTQTDPGYPRRTCFDISVTPAG